VSKQYEFVKAEQRSPEWHALRKDGITATDASVIAGHSPYKTPYRLWAEKIGYVESAPVGAAAHRGILLEQAVADYYEAETGRKLKRSNGIVRLKEFPWAMASLDRTIVGETGLVEIKTSTSPRWTLHPVPPEVEAQVQWQMFVKADTDYQGTLYQKALEFRKMLKECTPPPAQGEDSDALAAVNPQQSEDIATASPSLDRVARLYEEHLYESKLLDQTLQNLAVALKEAIGEKQGIAGNGWIATWRQNKPSTKTDWEKVAETIGAIAPETYAEAVKRLTQEKAGARVFKFKGGTGE
jgi:putative phage-type endonuclease